MPAGKLAKVEKSRLKIDMLGLCETRWASTGVLKTEKTCLYYSGGLISKNRNEVAVMISKKVVKYGIDFCTD